MAQALSSSTGGKVALKAQRRLLLLVLLLAAGVADAATFTTAGNGKGLAGEQQSQLMAEHQQAPDCCS